MRFDVSDGTIWCGRIDWPPPQSTSTRQTAMFVTSLPMLWLLGFFCEWYIFFFFYILSVFMVISRAPPSSCFLRAAGLCTAIAILVCSAGCFILLYSRVLRPSPINLALPLLASSFRSHLPSYIFFAWKVWSDQKSPTIIQLKATSHVLPVAFHAFFYNDSRYVE